MLKLRSLALFIIGILIIQFNYAQQKPAKQVEKKMEKAKEIQPAMPVNSTQINSFLDSVSYCIGVNIKQNLVKQGLTDLNIDYLAEGLKSETYNQKIHDTIMNQVLLKFQQVMIEKKQIEMAEAAAAEKQVASVFFENNGKDPEVVTLPSGLQYKVIKHSDSINQPHPTLNSKVVCHYHGTLLDGTIFDSSKQRGEPATFSLNGVILGWQEGIQLMTPGDIFMFWIPSDLAYGDRGQGPIKPGSALVFEVELISFSD